jgi:hypothetical protein
LDHSTREGSVAYPAQAMVLGPYMRLLWIGRRLVYCDHMGFNPFREQKKGVLDVALVVLAVAITVALVAWGFLGG